MLDSCYLACSWYESADLLVTNQSIGSQFHINNVLTDSDCSDKFCHYLFQSELIICKLHVTTPDNVSRNITGYKGLGTPQRLHTTNPTERHSFVLLRQQDINSAKVQDPFSNQLTGDQKEMRFFFFKVGEKFNCHTTLQGSSTTHPFFLPLNISFFFFDLLPQCSEPLESHIS